MMPKPTKLSAAVSLATAALLAASPASAATTIYTDQSAFLAALQGITTEDFNDATLIPGLSITSSVGEVNGASGPGTFFDRLVLGSQTTEFQFASPVNGFGGNFDLSPNGQGVGISFTLNPGGPVGTEVSSAIYTGQFWGLISDTAFSSILLQGGSQGGAAETYTLDNLTTGTLSASTLPEGVGAAPEPGTWAMMLVGFGLVGASLRRSKRAPRLAVSFA